MGRGIIHLEESHIPFLQQRQMLMDDRRWIIDFSDTDSGTFEPKFYESENGQLVYKESGIGIFTIEEYSVAELPTTKGWMWFDHTMGLFEY